MENNDMTPVMDNPELSPSMMAPRAQRLRATPEATLEDARRPLGLSEESEEQPHESEESDAEEEPHESEESDAEDEPHESEESDAEDEPHESEESDAEDEEEFLNEFGEVEEEIRALRR